MCNSGCLSERLLGRTWLGDPREGLRKWGFTPRWMLSESGGNSMILYRSSSHSFSTRGESLVFCELESGLFLSVLRQNDQVASFCLIVSWSQSDPVWVWYSMRSFMCQNRIRWPTRQCEDSFWMSETPLYFFLLKGNKWRTVTANDRERNLYSLGGVQGLPVSSPERYREDSTEGLPKRHISWWCNQVSLHLVGKEVCWCVCVQGSELVDLQVLRAQSVCGILFCTPDKTTYACSVTE